MAKQLSRFRYDINSDVDQIDRDEPYVPPVYAGGAPSPRSPAPNVTPPAPTSVAEVTTGLVAANKDNVGLLQGDAEVDLSMDEDNSRGGRAKARASFRRRQPSMSGLRV